MASVRDQHYEPSANGVAESAVGLLKRERRSVKILRIGIVGNEVALVLLVENTMAGKEEVDDILSASDAGKPRFERGAYLSEGGLLVGQQADIAGGNRSSGRAAKKIREVLGIAMREA